MSGNHCQPQMFIPKLHTKESSRTLENAWSMLNINAKIMVQFKIEKNPLCSIQDSSFLHEFTTAIKMVVNAFWPWATLSLYIWVGWNIYFTLNAKFLNVLWVLFSVDGQMSISNPFYFLVFIVCCVCAVF